MTKDDIFSYILNNDDVVPTLVKDWVLSLDADQPRFFGELRLIGLSHFLAENYHASPSMFIRRFGFWTIARLDTGNAICLDVHHGTVTEMDSGALMGKKEGEGFIYEVHDGVGRQVRCNQGHMDHLACRTYKNVSDFLNSYQIQASDL